MNLLSNNVRVRRAGFLGLLIAVTLLVIMPIAMDKAYAAPGDISNFKVEDPANGDNWAPQVKVSWEGAGSSGWIVGCDSYGSNFADTFYSNYAYDTATIFEADKTYRYVIIYNGDVEKNASFDYTPDMSKFTPSAISGAAKASGNSIELTWPKKNELKVNIYKDSTKIDTVPSSDESYKISGLEYDTAYTYKIAYVNQHKEGAQQTLTAKTEAKPAETSTDGSGSDSSTGGSGSGDGTGSGSGDGIVYDPDLPYLGINQVYATKIGANKAVVRWIGAYDAQGYYVYQGKKKVKTVKASVKRVTIKRKGAGKAKFRVIPYAKYNGKLYKGDSYTVKPKANQLTTINSSNYKNYSYGKGQLVMKKIKASGKKYKLTIFAINNRMFRLIKYKKIKISIYADGKLVAKKTFKNKKVNMKKYSSKKLTFTLKGKEADIANGNATWSIVSSPYWEHGYEGF